MPDPVTIGALVATALGMAGEAMLKGAVGEATKDAYKALRDKASRWLGNDLTELERAPASDGRRAVVSEILDRLPPGDVESLHASAQELVATLKAENVPIGLDIGRLSALELELGNIKVSEGIGARIVEGKVGGTFKVGDITVGKS
jgi:hypothetical protein